MPLHGQAAVMAALMLLLVSPLPASAFTCYGCSDCGLYSCSTCSSTSYGDACSSTGYSYTYSCGGKLAARVNCIRRGKGEWKASVTGACTCNSGSCG